MKSVLTVADVCAVVVTYRPDQAALNCLRSVLAQVAHAVVFDNGSDRAALEALHELSKVESVTLVESKINLGVAAGLNGAISAAYRLGYRWFLLLDQDSQFLPDGIEELVAVYRQSNVDTQSRVGLVGANFYHQMEDGSVLPARVPYSPNRAWVESETIITSGTLISWSAFREIGLFREELFIDSVDHEYCFRARSAGFLVLKSVRPLMIHRLGMAVNRKVWYRPGRRVSLSCHSSLRRYYQVRNFIVVAAQYRRQYPAEIAKIRAEIYKDIKRAVLFEGKPMKLLRAIIGGFIDAKRGRLGKCKYAF